MSVISIKHKDLSVQWQFEQVQVHLKVRVTVQFTVCKKLYCSLVHILFKILMFLHGQYLMVLNKMEITQKNTYNNYFSSES